jgi:predicted Fe-S protein YdhL (DUF1289 family)
MRKREERFAWLTMSPDEKKHVIKLCGQRYRRKMAKNKIKPAHSDTQEDNPQGDLF